MITYMLTKMFYFLFNICGPLRNAAAKAERRLYNEHLGDIWPSKDDLAVPVHIILDDGKEPELNTES